MVDIIIVNWNTKDLLEQCLDTLIRNSPGNIPLNIIVVDNASQDGSVEMVRERFQSVTIIENAENVGFARANNLAISKTSSPYVFLLNSDTIVQEDILTPLVRYLESHPRTAMVGCRLQFPDGSRQVGDAGYRPGPRTAFNFAFFLSRIAPSAFEGLFLNGGPGDRPISVDWVSGAAVMVRREAIDQVGALKEDFFMYAEDVEWGVRMREHGWEVHYLPTVRVTHLQGGSERSSRSPSTRWLENLYAFTRQRSSRAGYAGFALSMSAGLLIRMVAYSILAALPGAGPRLRKQRRMMTSAFLKSLAMLGTRIATVVLAIPAAALTTTPAFATPPYHIGVYYFPGWTHAPTEWWNPPWERIRPFPEREPLLGHYAEGSVEVATRHLGWMAAHGIDFVVYDWYWTSDNRPKLDHAIEAYLKAPNRRSIDFSLLWANHDDIPGTTLQFERMVDYWIARYFKEPGYLKRDEKPVVYVFSPERLRDQAQKLGTTTRALLDKARRRAVAAGLPGIYFVACTQAISYWVRDYLPRAGYDALSGYNYHAGYSGQWVDKPLATSYAALTAGYLESWSWMLTHSPLPYHLPLTAGWDSRPWGGASSHDNCRSTPDEFERHLLAARGFLDRYPERTGRTAVICAWNEFGEGSYIEPTKHWGFAYLERVRKVFGGA